MPAAPAPQSGVKSHHVIRWLVDIPRPGASAAIALRGQLARSRDVKCTHQPPLEAHRQDQARRLSPHHMMCSQQAPSRPRQSRASWSRATSIEAESGATSTTGRRLPSAESNHIT